MQYQIGVPAKYRHHVLMLGHATSMSGHLGVKNKYFRILKHFVWPCIKTDAKRYCKTCTFCQMAGKPNQKHPNSPGPLDNNPEKNRNKLTISAYVLETT